MQCPQCGAENADEAARCAACHHDLSDVHLTAARDLVRTTLVGGESREQPQRLSRGFEEGSELGNRYYIVRRLGEGGMGEVYLARDRELDRTVALKVIRVDLASHPAILERFKREIQLSSNITHKNVLRVYDLGEVAGVKFLTMQYVDGEDLASLMRRSGRLPLPQVIDIFRQTCEGLQAAHEQGVIHRDLKPQNILIDRHGRVAIADFGLAKSYEQVSLTEAGKVIGTPHYMSPEQVKGIPLDQRSDLYSLGIILYEMLTGTVPFTGSSAYEVMIQRTQRTPRPASDHNPKIPPYLQKILERCLLADPLLRYGSAAEILHDLDTQTFHSSLRYRVRRQRRLAAAVIAGIVLLAGGIAGWRVLRISTQRATEAAHKPVSVLIADVDNRTGESIFDGTLEPILTLALEGAPFITSYNRGQAHKVAAQIQPNASNLDEQLARLVAVREGINVVVAGTIDRSGSYRLTLQARDGANGNPIASSEVTAETKQEVLSAVGRAAADLRKALGDTTPMSTQLAAAETFTAGSLEAAHEYALGQDFFYHGKYEDAVKRYEQAIKLDPNLGRAYASLGAAYNNMGRASDAVAEFKLAMSHIDRMTDREKYRTRATYYLITRNNPKAIEELNQLLKQYPADVNALINLALAYFYNRDMSRALEESQRAITVYPKNYLARNNAALYAMYAGDFGTAIQQAQNVLSLNPAFIKAFVAIALSQLGQNDVNTARQTYERLASLSAAGKSSAAMGLADIALYEGATTDAVRILKDGIESDRTDQKRDPLNWKLATLAAITVDANAAEQVITTGTHDVHALYTAAQTLLAAGKEQRALAIASQLGAQLEPELQHHGKLIEGEALMKQGKARDAVARFEEAKRLADSWLLRFDRGRAYLDLGAFTEAEADFENCFKRRGEATAVFLDDVPTFHYFPLIYYYLGRAQEGLHSANAAESYKQFLAIKTKGDGDPLVADARRRLGIER